MRICSKCKQEKEASDFYKDRKNKVSGLSSWCKTCQTSDKKIHYINNKNYYIWRGLENKKWFYEFKKTLSCNRCGFAHPAALDFHHVDPTTKSFNFGSINPVLKNKDAIMNEIAKCEVLCSNCHRIEHAKHYNV
jgi:hypothetical protein